MLILTAILIDGIPELLTNSPISLFPPSGNPSPSQTSPFAITGLIGATITLIAITVLQSVISRMALNDKQGKDVALFGTFKQVLPVLPWVILVDFVASIAIGVGLIFLILPGIVIGFLLLLVVPVATLEERTGISDVFARSKELVKGSFLEIFAIGLIVAAPFAILSVVVGLLKGAPFPPPITAPMQTNLGFGIVDMGFGIVGSLSLAVVTAFIYLHLSESIPRDNSTTTSAENLKGEGFNPFD